jgi:N-acyl-D-amino-acid deacylase
MKFDTIIRGGTVIDGEGSPGRRSDIGVAGGRIAAIADLSDAVHNAPTVIEVHGHIVCPGFIDLHTHSDLTLVDHPDGESKAYQGVTTEVNRKLWLLVVSDGRRCACGERIGRGADLE